MTTFFNTMLVPTATPSFPHSPKPISPTPTLEQSTSYFDVSGVGANGLRKGDAVDARPNWSLASLFSSPLHTFFGVEKGSHEPEPHARHGKQGDTRPRASIDSLRSSLDLPLRPSPPRKLYAAPPQTPQTQKRQKQDVNTFIFHRNARSKGHFKPQKTNRGTSSWQLRQFAEATLGSGSLRKAVKLPEGEDLNEWLAVNVVDFYNQINLLYGSITEFCSPQTCPEMKATDEFEYLWQDSETYKKPTKMPAPEYIEHLMAWCQSNIDNEAMFPSRIGVQFPKTFPSLVRQMFKRLYRVYAHIYCHHYPVVTHLGLEPHLNTSFKHYVLFINEHQLASGKDYWGPLGELVESMLSND